MPEDTPYSTLKERLLKTHTLSSFEKLEQLLKQLEAHKPSQLLNSMAGGEGWLLPLHVCTVPSVSASVAAHPAR